MTAASLTGCSLGGETIPKNRTKEQYEFEKKFEPMFEFLEKDKKEFNGLEAYQSSVYVTVGDDVKNYEVNLDTTIADIKGNYTITLGDTKETVPVTYSNGRLQYESKLEPLFDEEILNLVVKREYFASLDVKETFKSPETELFEIIFLEVNIVTSSKEVGLIYAPLSLLRSIEVNKFRIIEEYLFLESITLFTYFFSCFSPFSSNENQCNSTCLLFFFIIHFPYP